MTKVDDPDILTEFGESFGFGFKWARFCNDSSEFIASFLKMIMQRLFKSDNFCAFIKHEDGTLNVVIGKDILKIGAILKNPVDFTLLLFFTGNQVLWFEFSFFYF